MSQDATEPEEAKKIKDFEALIEAALRVNPEGLSGKHVTKPEITKRARKPQSKKAK